MPSAWNFQMLREKSKSYPQENIYDTIIIGGGPAGITAGIYAGRQRLKTLLITKAFGGQMAQKATAVCNYPGFPRILGSELIKKFVGHLKTQETVEIKNAQVIKVEKKENGFKVVTDENKEFFAKSVIVTTGADPRPLEAPGEKEFIGKGVGYCVTCDGPLFKNKSVAVIGGGNSGIEAALFMTRYAKEIFVLEYGPEIKADAENQADAGKNKKIQIITNAAVKEIKGNKMVSALVYEDLTAKKTKELSVQGIFIEIGTQPATSLIRGLVDFNDKDEIIVDFETFQTKTPGLFAAGDVNMGKYKQIITAAGEGCKVALAAYEYIRRKKP